MEPEKEEENIVAGLYDGYQDTQREILEIEIRKTKIKLFTIAAVVFGFDLLALLAANLVNADTILYIAIIPAIMVGLAFLAMKEPLLAMIIAALIIVAVWIYIIAMTGSQAAITGWLGKAILVYLLIAGFQSAREAQRIKKELKG
jgi:lysylphosphatidylglycerol synthetase-like protein (DUF2156 family)